MPFTCDIGRAERMDVLDRFRAGGLRALVSAQVLNEGLDVPDAEVGIVMGGRSASASICSESAVSCGHMTGNAQWSTSWWWPIPVTSLRADGGGSALLREADLPLRVIAWDHDLSLQQGRRGPAPPLVVESAIVESAIDIGGTTRALDCRCALNVARAWRDSTGGEKEVAQMTAHGKDERRSAWKGGVASGLIAGGAGMAIHS